MKKTRVISILGMHRSGTSVVARAINLLGAYIGKDDDLLPANEDNPTGYWEHRGIVDIQEKIFKLFSQTWDTHLPLPDKWWESPVIVPLKKELFDLIQSNFAGKKLWMWKDPRTSVLLPIWHSLLDNLSMEISFIITIRNPYDVMKSLVKREGFSSEKALSIWYFYTLSSLYWTNNSNRIIILYDEFIEDWKTNIKKICEKLELPFPQNDSDTIRTLNSLIQPSLRHSKTEISDLKKLGIPKYIENLYKLCLEGNNNPDILSDSGYRNQIKALYEDYLFLGNSFLNIRPNIIAQVFWRNGENTFFSEDDSMHFALNIDGQYHRYEAKIPSAFREIRFDPMNFFPASATIKSIRLINEHIEEIVIVENGKINTKCKIKFGSGILPVKGEEGLAFVCTNSDPQLYIEFDKVIQGGLKIAIEMKVYSFPEEAVLEKIKNEIHEYAEQIAVKSAQCDGLARQLMDLQNLNHQQNERIKSLEREISDYNRQLSDVISTLEALWETNRMLQEQIDVEKEINRSLQDQLAAEREINRMLQQQAVHDRMMLQSILESKSWRLTKPLRDVSHFIKRLRRNL